MWILRGASGEGFSRVFSALNLRRDELLVAGRRLWAWTEPGDLERVVHAAPDLWRYRTQTLVLRPNLTEDAGLPTPVPAIAWPWSWRRGPTAVASAPEINHSTSGTPSGKTSAITSSG